MDRRDSASLATFFTTETPHKGTPLELGEAAALHARARRLKVGDAVCATDGHGTVGIGWIARLSESVVEVTVGDLEIVPRMPRLELLAPVADRERMLWLAEKATELGVTDWQPVVYARSRSVSPRGEGDAFARKVRARMESALEQSGGAWMPQIRKECAPEEAVTRCGAAARFVLVRGAAPLTAAGPFADVAVTLGPEGGLEPAELDFLTGSGWRATSLGRSTLRFETAGIAALAIVRAGQ